MRTKDVLRIGLACAATITIAGCAANAGPSTSALGSPQAARAYHALHFLPTRSADHAIALTGGLFPYQGGPVLVTPKLYLIFWGYKKAGDPEKVAPLLEAYAKAVGGSGHNNIYTQYYEIVSSETNYITNPKHQLGGVWFDNSPIPAEPTDAQVADEALKGVAKLGYDPDGSYLVATAHDHNSQGFGTEWCSYHDATYTSGQQLVSYTNLPYIPDAGANCGADFIKSPHHPRDESREDEGVTIVEGVEYGDSITDPNPGTGWYNESIGEIGAACAWVDIALDRFGKKVYTTAPMYSNANGSCVQVYKK
jgi:hypothetical protein